MDIRKNELIIRFLLVWEYLLAGVIIGCAIWVLWLLYPGNN